MGTRGPLPVAQARRRNVKTVVQLAEGSPLPAPPEDLGRAGLVVWSEASNIVWVRDSDRLAVEQLARLEDEATNIREARQRLGHYLMKPIVTPRGDVVGEEIYVNPLTDELRKVEKSVDKLRVELGFSPLSRARLGIAVVTAEQGATQLARMREDITEDEDLWANDPRLPATQLSDPTSADGSKDTSSTGRAMSKANRSSSTKSSGRSSGARTSSTRKATRGKAGASTGEDSSAGQKGEPSPS